MPWLSAAQISGSGWATLPGSLCSWAGRRGCMREAQRRDRGGYATWSGAWVWRRGTCRRCRFDSSARVIAPRSRVGIEKFNHLITTVRIWIANIWKWKHLNIKLSLVRYYKGGLNTELNLLRYSNDIQIPDQWAIRHFWPFEYQTSPVFRSPLYCDMFP